VVTMARLMILTTILTFSSTTIPTLRMKMELRNERMRSQ